MPWRHAGWPAGPRCRGPGRAASADEHRAQRLGVGAGDVEVDGGHRVARHPLDPVDVGAGVGDPAGDGRERARPSAGRRSRSRGSGPRAAAGCRRCRGRPRRSCPAPRRSPRRASRSFFQSRGAVTRTPRTRRRRSTICSMSRTSTPASASVEKIAEVTPGRSLPHEGDQQGLGSFRHFGHRGPEAIARVPASARCPWPGLASDDMTHTHHTIDYIELNVSDLAASKEFYEQAFGWQFNDYGPDYAGIRARSGDGEVGGLSVGRPPGPGGSLVHPLLRRPRGDRRRGRGGRRAGHRGSLRVPRRAAVPFTDPSGNRSRCGRPREPVSPAATPRASRPRPGRAGPPLPSPRSASRRWSASWR